MPYRDDYVVESELGGIQRKGRRDRFTPWIYIHHAIWTFSHLLCTLTLGAQVGSPTFLRRSWWLREVKSLAECYPGVRWRSWDIHPYLYNSKTRLDATGLLTEGGEGINPWIISVVTSVYPQEVNLIFRNSQSFSRPSHSMSNGMWGLKRSVTVRQGMYWMLICLAERCFWKSGEQVAAGMRCGWHRMLWLELSSSGSLGSRMLRGSIFPFLTYIHIEF